MNKVCVVIQGPTTFYKEILESLDLTCADYVWSTWEDEDSFSIEQISKVIPVIKSKKPFFSGFGNVNMQTVSSYEGMRNLDNDFILKIRSDIKVSSFKKMIDVFLKSEKLSFLCLHDIPNGIKYAVDYISFGPNEQMKEFWNFFSLERSYQIPAEIQILKSYARKQTSNEKDCLLSFDYFLDDLDKNDVDLVWLKNSVNIRSYLLSSQYVGQTSKVKERLTENEHSNPDGW